MRKTRLLSLLLTVVFVLANVTIPSFADGAYTYGDPAAIVGLGNPIAPLAGMPHHISYAVNSDASYEANYLPTGFSLSEDGILNIANDASIFDASGHSVTANVYVNITTEEGTVKGPNIQTVYGSFNFPFDDGVLPNTTYNPNSRSIANNLEITSDASGRVYAKKQAGKGYSSMYAQTLVASRTGGTGPFVIEMDVLDFSELQLYETPGYYRDLLPLSNKTIIPAWKEWVVNSGGTINPNFPADFSSNGWHNYKWVITPDTKEVDGELVYPHLDLYIDDINLAKNVPFYGPGAIEWTNSQGKPQVTPGATHSWQKGHDKNLQWRLYFSGIDNLKRYATSLGFAHDVSISSADGVITASAQIAHMPQYNVPEALEYAFFVGDQVEGDFELIPGTIGSDTFVPADEYAGRVIKAAARVKEAPIHENPCTTDWVLSSNAVVVEPNYRFAYSDPALTMPNNATITAPLAGLPYRIAHTMAGGPATYAANKSVTGITLSEDGILNISDGIGSFHDDKLQNIQPNVNVTTTLYGGETKVGPTIKTIYTSFNYTFDDGKLPKDGFVGGGNRPALKAIEITSDASGKIYAKHNGEGNYMAFMAQQAFKSSALTNLPFYFEFEAQNFYSSFSIMTSYPSTKLIDLTGSYVLSQTWLDELKAKGVYVNPDFDASSFSSRGWHKYKWLITPTTYTVGTKTVLPQFDLYIDDQLVIKGARFEGPGVDGSYCQTSDNGVSNYTVKFYASGVDNLKLYGTTLGFAHDVKLTGEAAIGSTVNVSAQKAAFPLSNIPEALEYALFAADTADGEYVKVADGASLEITSALAGKYVKAAARVKESIDDGVATEWVYTENATYVAPVAISSIALTVDGEDADIDAVNLAGKTEAQIDITITAASSDESAAKFVLAQYATVDGKKVLVGAALNDAALTSDAASFDLSLSASGINASSSFRLFILTANGLVPVKDIVIK